MRVSLEWLTELLKIDGSVEELANRLTMSGIAVEEIEDQAAQYQGIIAAKVLSLEKHGQADNLLIAQVDIGTGKRQVITGAKNLKPGDIVPLAVPGTTLPNGKTIEEAMFKGVLSQGMLCSGAELGLEKESGGIWVFEDTAATLGASISDLLGENDQILVLELTANRSDCLGMMGVAREAAAVLEKSFTKPSVAVTEKGPAIESLVSIRIADPDLCPRYSARVIEGVTIGPSPQWMQRRLKAAGIRPISNIVDITNYVLLEYNQPLHAFDLDHIPGRDVIVRRAKQGEKMVTLDEIERQFSSDNLLIACPAEGLCVAGVMGGSSSEVTEKTTRVLLESAYFNPVSIRKTARQLGMRSEASLRFERGIDPNGTVEALNRAAQLMAELGGGTMANGVIDLYPSPVQPRTIRTSTQTINQWLGTAISEDSMKEYLKRVKFEVESLGNGGIQVTVPTYRRDVSHMADLAEEVARLYGYNRIPVTVPAGKQLGERTPFQKFQQECRKLLLGCGLTETMSYSLYAQNTPSLLGIDLADDLAKTVALMVPLSEDQAVLRTNMAHSLIETVAFNVKRRQTNLSIFEMARVYWPQPKSVLPQEPLHLGMALTGQRHDTGWNQVKNEVDFYDLKGILELLIDKFRFAGVTLESSKRPFLHPGQSAEIVVNGESAGYLGQVHPDVLKKYEMNQRIFILEVDLSSVWATIDGRIVFEPLPKFPAVQRDLALVAPMDVKAENISAKIEELSGGLVEKVELFDVYQGGQVPEGMRSLAFSLSYRSREKTLNDSEVNKVQEELLTKLNALYGAALRNQ